MHSCGPDSHRSSPPPTSKTNDIDKSGKLGRGLDEAEDQNPAKRPKREQKRAMPAYLGPNVCFACNGALASTKPRRMGPSLAATVTKTHMKGEVLFDKETKEILPKFCCIRCYDKCTIGKS